LLSTLALALLGAGEVREALGLFERASSVHSTETRGESQSYLKWEATAHWLLGERAQAVQKFTLGMDLLGSGRTKFADNAGGVLAGLQVAFVAIEVGDEALLGRARKFLVKLSKKPRVKYWPGPLALLFLQQRSLETVLATELNAQDLESAISRAATDLLLRRGLVQALFYEAMRLRADGRNESAVKALRRVVDLKNPAIEPEWYLAEAELKHLKRDGAG